MRAQASIEFTLIMGFATVLLVTFLGIAAFHLRTVSTERYDEQTRDIAFTVQQELLTAQAVHDGYNRTFTLPQRIANTPYTLTLINDSTVSVVHITWKQTDFTVRTPLCIGTLQPGRNYLSKQNDTLYCNP
jgi:hypothetical protein